jgi:hypothetical protein
VHHSWAGLVGLQVAAGVCCCVLSKTHVVHPTGGFWVCFLLLGCKAQYIRPLKLYSDERCCCCRSCGSYATPSTQHCQGLLSCCYQIRTWVYALTCTGLLMNCRYMYAAIHVFAAVLLLAAEKLLSVGVSCSVLDVSCLLSLHNLV